MAGLGALQPPPRGHVGHPCLLRPLAVQDCQLTERAGTRRDLRPSLWLGWLAMLRYGLSDPAHPVQVAIGGDIVAGAQDQVAVDSPAVQDFKDLLFEFLPG